MPDDKDKGLSVPKTRKFPIALVSAAAVFLFVLSFVGKSVILFSLRELTLSMLLFLVLAAVFADVPVKIKAFLTKKKPVRETDKTDGEKAPPVSEPPADGLIEIQKETVLHQSQTKTDLFWRICEIAYIVLFCGIAVWRVFRTFAFLPVSFTGLQYSIVYAVLLLVFPCIALIYLQIRKDPGSCPGDTISHGILSLFSYVSIIYAALIAASSALKLPILGALRWVYVIASVYLIVSIAFNILLSVLKKNILSDFNYMLIPKFSKTKGKKDGFLDSQEIKQNFSLKSLYTIKYALKILPGVLLGLGFILFLSTALFVVQPHQQALVYRFGRLNMDRPGGSPLVGEGLHVKFPWPIDKADIYDIHRVNSMQIGYQSPYSANYLWTRAHDGGENMLLLGNGNEMVAVNMRIIYKISDLYGYVKTSTDPEAVLSAAAYEALMDRTVDTTLESFLSVDRSSLSASLSDELSLFCESSGIGLSVLQVIIESIHPPVDIADIYQRVVTALVIKDTIITRAQTEAERTIIDAQRESKTVLDNAAARRHNRVSEAQKEMAVYYAAAEAYRENPRAFQLTKYLDTYEKIINGNKVYVFSPGMEAGISKSVIGNANANILLGTAELTE